MTEETNANEANEANAAATGVTGAAPATDNGAAPSTEPEINVIEVKNPTKEEMEKLREKVENSLEFSVTTKPIKFHFKKSKDSDTGIITDRRPVELAVPYPNLEGILKILESEDTKQIQLLMDAVEDVVNSAARDILYESTELNAATFPYERITWEAISKIPKTTRRGGGIPKETWDEFAADYIKVMPAAAGKTLEQVQKAASLLKGKLAQCKTNKPVLELLVSQLAIYAEKSPAAEEYSECIEFLAEKANSLLNVSPEELLADL